MASAASIVIVFYTLARHPEYPLPRGVLRDRDLIRLALAGSATAVALLWLCRRDRVWPRVALACLSMCAVLGLALLARGAVPTWPVRDGAMTELYTIHATHGSQLLGAFSQFGWHHPGPLFFYLLAPLYVLGGRSVAAFDAGALAINLASAGVIIWVMARRKEPSSFVPEVFLGLLTLYVIRVPELLTSAWNPHPPVLAFAALVTLCAATLAGELTLLPLTALFASFIAQTHIGYAPVSSIVLALTFGATAVATLRSTDQRRRWIRYTLATVFVLEFAWILPVAEQLTGNPGNMTLIWRFFFSGEPGQPAALAWRAWSGGIGAAVSSNLSLPVGMPISMSPGAWPLIAGTASVLALGPIGLWARRRGDAFCVALTLICALTSLVGLWSVRHIQGTIADYHAFWLSIIGLFNVALVAGVLLRIAATSMGGGRRGDIRDVHDVQDVNDVSYRRLLTGAALLGAITWIGCANLIVEKQHSESQWDNTTVRHLTEQILENLAARSHPAPLIRFSSGMWDVGPGLVLQMARASVPITVDASAAATYGLRFVATGREDLLLTVCGPDLHRQLAMRPNNVTIAREQSAAVFVDAVSLIDTPQYR